LRDARPGRLGRHDRSGDGARLLGHRRDGRRLRLRCCRPVLSPPAPRKESCGAKVGSVGEVQHDIFTVGLGPGCRPAGIPAPRCTRGWDNGQRDPCGN
jgi:hypothetical protein